MMTRDGWEGGGVHDGEEERRDACVLDARMSLPIFTIGGMSALLAIGGVDGADVGQPLLDVI